MTASEEAGGSFEINPYVAGAQLLAPVLTPARPRVLTTPLTWSQNNDSMADCRAGARTILSVPTVYHVLNSKVRPNVFTRSYRTDAEACDPAKLGWKITELDSLPGSDLDPRELRKIYDTTQPGRGNGGHTFGDRLIENERMVVIEYLKTL